MNSKLAVFRAMSAVVLRRALLVCGIIGGVLLLLLLLGIWGLASAVSSWWWLLLLLYLPLLFVATILWVLIRFLSKKLYPARLSREQKVLLDDFTNKLQRLLETRGIGWPWFALLNLKDFLFHRELRTTKKLIEDTTSLRHDFAELEQKLQS